MWSEVCVVYANLDHWKKYFPSSKFYVNFHTCRPCHQGQFLFCEWGQIRLQLILKIRRLSLMVHTFQNLEDFEFNSRFRNSSTLRSLKYVINIIIWIRDTGCYTWSQVQHAPHSHNFPSSGLHDQKPKMAKLDADGPRVALGG
jgi:hypothetical protein